MSVVGVELSVILFSILATAMAIKEVTAADVVVVENTGATVIK